MGEAIFSGPKRPCTFLLGTPDHSVPGPYLSCACRGNVCPQSLLLLHYKGGEFPKLGVLQLDANPLHAQHLPGPFCVTPWDLGNKQNPHGQVKATAFAVINSDVSDLLASMKQQQSSLLS